MLSAIRMSPQTLQISATKNNRIQNNGRSSIVTCAAPSPAWPGRAVAPEKTVTRDGPKVRAESIRDVRVGIPIQNMHPAHLA
jgi:hypothetical protein